MHQYYYCYCCRDFYILWHQNFQFKSFAVLNWIF